MNRQVIKKICQLHNEIKNRNKNNYNLIKSSFVISFDKTEETESRNIFNLNIDSHLCYKAACFF